MRLLFVVICLLISYGSLYPFQFDLTAASWHDWSLLATWTKKSGLHDKLSNLVLFVPYGLVGVLHLRRLSPYPLLGLILGGFVLAFVLQIAQLYIPARDALLTDALWNLFGLLLGMLPGLLSRGVPWRKWLPKLPPLSVPIALALSWLLYRLFPWIPSLDWQEWKNSLKPLLYQSPNWVPVLHDLCGWLLCFSLLQTGLARRLRSLWLWYLVPGIWLLEILIIQNSLSWNTLLGGLLALLLWPGLGRHHPGLLAGLVWLQILLQGLYPFHWAPTVQAFSWIPFQGFLQGAVWTNTLALLEKCFFFGGTLFLMRQAGARPLSSSLLLSLSVAIIEACQQFLLQHRPEITDPLLVLLIAVLLVESPTNSGFALPAKPPIMRHPNSGS